MANAVVVGSVFVLRHHQRKWQQTKRKQNCTQIHERLCLHEAKAQNTNRHGKRRELVKFNFGKLFHALHQTFVGNGDGRVIAKFHVFVDVIRTRFVGHRGCGQVVV